MARERNKEGETVASYTYDLNGKPLTITMGETTYWYVYNAHGDVVAITDGTGAVQARYEYDDWGRLEAMYDADGRVREGYGTIGDLGTGPSRPANGKPTPGTEDWSSGGNGQGNGKANGKGNAYGKSKQKGGALDALAPQVQQLAPEPEALLLADGGEEGELQIQGVIGEPDDLVKRNPYRYAGYRYDRETQYYYLRARYYDGRLGRFLSQDTWAGDVRKPLTLNRYIYAVNNPVNYVDPDGRTPLCGDDGSDGNVICLDDGERLVSPASQRYSGREFTVPPLGPSGDQRPNREQTEFIRYLYDIGEESDYGPRTQNAVAGLQRAHGIPVDGQVMIGPRTWELLVLEFERRLGSFETAGHVDGGYGPRSTVKQVDMSFVGRQTLSVTAADDQKMSGMSPTTLTSYLLCLQEEADYGTPQALGCFLQWPERFGGLEAIPAQLAIDGMLEAAGLTGMGAFAGGVRRVQPGNGLAQSSPGNVRYFSNHWEDWDLEFDDAPRGRTGKGGKKSGGHANGQIRDAGRRAGMNDHEIREFGDYVEARKQAEGRGGADNYSFKELQEMAREWKGGTR